LNVLSDQAKKEILEHFPEQYHEMLQKQVLVIEGMINKHLFEYQYSQDFRKAIDLVLVDVLNGKYLGRSFDES
jgi:Tfp pilus assembly ATPase PilU